MEKIIKQLKNCLKSSVLEKEPMKKHTSFRTGGEAELFIPIENVEDLKMALSILKENQIPFFIMGNGTNLLVRDSGYKGAILQIFQKMNGIKQKECGLEAEAGALLSAVSAEAQKAELTGMEFASGIPGTLGGAVCMNAGAYGGEMKQILTGAEVLKPDGSVCFYPVEKLELSYRNSIISKDNLIVLKAFLRLQKGKKEEIARKMTELALQRKEKQPLNYPSAGSTFKRPEGYFAGKLISDSGLKGFSIGGAQISEKHAGFLINQGGASATDILNVIEHCQKTVFEKFGVWLETEVKVIGEQ